MRVGQWLRGFGLAAMALLERDCRLTHTRLSNGA